MYIYNQNLTISLHEDLDLGNQYHEDITDAFAVNSKQCLCLTQELRVSYQSVGVFVCVCVCVCVCITLLTASYLAITFSVYIRK